MRPARIALATSALAATAVLATACAGSSGTAGATSAGNGKPSGQVGGQLTVGFPAAPPSLDPATAHGHSGVFFYELAYEPLIVLDGDGQYKPGLATSWHYAGSGNTTFVLNLRSGVKFSDGSPLTGQGVAAYFSYLQKAPGQNAALLAGARIAATGPLQVTIKTAKPNPDLAYDMTQDVGLGEVISPAALKKPSASLGSQTAGAGPYTLSTAQTSSGSVYTYVPNPNYFDKAARHYRKVVVKIIQNPQSALQAMESGQIDTTLGDSTTLSAAKRAGLVDSAATITNNVTGVTLADRGGTTAKPLANLKVRQALNYATNRAAITRALFPGSTPTSEMATPGTQGYDPGLAGAYPYNPAKARSLLAQAGYPKGFTLNLITTDTNSQSLLTQALAQQWRQVGVTLKIDDVANGNAYVTQALSGKFPAFTNNTTITPVATLATSLFLPHAAYNPYHYTDAALQKLYAQDTVSSGAAKAAADKKITAYLVRQAWFVPVVAQGLPVYARSTVTGESVRPPTSYPVLYDLQPAS